MPNINLSLVEAEISNSYRDGNNRHGRVDSMPYLLDLYGNRLSGAGRASAPAHQGVNEAYVIALLTIATIRRE